MDRMILLPPEIWETIFAFDPTYHDIFRTRVLAELLQQHTSFMAELFFYFFWDERKIVSIQYDDTYFHFETKDHNLYTVHYNNDNPIFFRIYNNRTGMWQEKSLEI